MQPNNLDMSQLAQPKTTGEQIPIDMAGVKVMIGIPTNRDFHPKTVIALVDTCMILQAKGIGAEVSVVFGGSIVTDSRSGVADNFMNSDCTHLFWIDSDITWNPADFITMLALGTQMEVVCAAYPMKNDNGIFTISYDDENRMVMNKYGCVPINSTGLGFTVVQRKVIEQLTAKAPLLKLHYREKPLPQIFRLGVKPGVPFDESAGEDTNFFDDVRALGYAVNLLPSITLGHVGPKEYRGSVMDCLAAVK